MPQLHRYRRIWVYLPLEHTYIDKRYPVLYMQDGQNLFDAVTSSFREWGIDKTLNKLQNEGNQGIIVVGIDSGGEHRTMNTHLGQDLNEVVARVCTMLSSLHIL